MIMTEHAQLAEDLFDEVDLLFVSIELALHNWKLACSDGTEQNVHTIDACDFDALEELVNRYINEFELSDDPQVVSCYEAGQDGFWVHRVLVEQLGIQNVVIDPASIEQDQRGKQAKTDPIDARKRVRKLVAYHRGDQEVFSICPVPPEQIEEDRRINRELKRLKKERTAHRNGIRGGSGNRESRSNSSVRSRRSSTNWRPGTEGNSGASRNGKSNDGSTALI